MPSKQSKSLSIKCDCGEVVLHAEGAPILAASCYCGDCQRAGHLLEALPSASHLLEGDGGTPVVLYRKDRIACETGKEHLAAFWFEASSPTRRVVATCCNSPMFLDFTKGHWLSIYRKRIPDGAPPLQMRIMTRDRPLGAVLAGDVPNHEKYPGAFMRKLIVTWIAMGFRRPDMGLGAIRRSTFQDELPQA